MIYLKLSYCSKSEKCKVKQTIEEDEDKNDHFFIFKKTVKTGVPTLINISFSLAKTSAGMLLVLQFESLDIRQLYMGTTGGFQHMTTTYPTHHTHNHHQVTIS